MKYKDQKFKNKQLLPIISNQKYNDYLKEIGKLAELEGNWYDYEFKGKEKFTIVTPRRDLSSHVARRTFVVMAYNEGVSLDMIALVTSHNDVKAMKPYLKATSKGSDKVIDAINRATMAKPQKRGEKSKKKKK